MEKNDEKNNEDDFEIFEQVRFGAEFEACIHVLNNKNFTEDPSEKSEEDNNKRNAIIAFYTCLKKRVKQGIKINLILDSAQRAVKYDQWTIMPDTSISCSLNGICSVKGNPEKCREELYFYPVEIITPALKGRPGIMYLKMFLQSYIFSDDMIYSINSSQGLHVNLSHPRMNLENFVRLWVYYEPVLVELVSPERRIRMNRFAAPIRDHIWNSLRKNSDSSFAEILKLKYYAINYKSFPAPRIEVRLYQGTMIYKEMISWILLCMRLLVLSIKNSPKPWGWETRKTKEKLLEEFFTEIADTQLIKIFNQKYNANKTPEWPVYDYSGFSQDLNMNKKFNTKERELIEKNQKISCADSTFLIYDIKEWKDEKGLLHRENDLPAVIHINGRREWYIHGVKHRDGDKPADISYDGSKTWYKNGKIYRDNDLPAFVGSDGTQEWYNKNGVYHRDGDKPAIIRRKSMEWWVNGRYIKRVLRDDDGSYMYGNADLNSFNDIPAINCHLGYDSEGNSIDIQVWYRNGVIHRDSYDVDGKLLPALITPKFIGWYINGEIIQAKKSEKFRNTFAEIRNIIANSKCYQKIFKNIIELRKFIRE